MAMQDLIKLVAARWRGASPLHIASFLLERPDQCGLQRDDDKMRTAKALYLQWALSISPEIREGVGERGDVLSGAGLMALS